MMAPGGARCGRARRIAGRPNRAEAAGSRSAFATQHRLAVALERERQWDYEWEVPAATQPRRRSTPGSSMVPVGETALVVPDWVTAVVRADRWERLGGGYSRAAKWCVTLSSGERAFVKATEGDLATGCVPGSGGLRGEPRCQSPGVSAATWSVSRSG
jgi:hypothetical protein